MVFHWVSIKSWNCYWWKLNGNLFFWFVNWNCVQTGSLLLCISVRGWNYSLPGWYHLIRVFRKVWMANLMSNGLKDSCLVVCKWIFRSRWKIKWLWWCTTNDSGNSVVSCIGGEPLPMMNCNWILWNSILLNFLVALQ